MVDNLIFMALLCQAFSIFFLISLTVTVYSVHKCSFKQLCFDLLRLLSVSADLRVRPMILVVKKWARHHKINDASQGTLSSYTLVLMVLHFLQSQCSHTCSRTAFHSRLYRLVGNLNLNVMRCFLFSSERTCAPISTKGLPSKCSDWF